MIDKKASILFRLSVCQVAAHHISILLYTSLKADGSGHLYPVLAYSWVKEFSVVPFDFKLANEPPRGCVWQVEERRGGEGFPGSEY